MDQFPQEVPHPPTIDTPPEFLSEAALDEEARGPYVVTPEVVRSLPKQRYTRDQAEVRFIELQPNDTPLRMFETATHWVQGFLRSRHV
jgi:hypothetical protein